MNILVRTFAIQLPVCVEFVKFRDKMRASEVSGERGQVV